MHESRLLLALLLLTVSGMKAGCCLLFLLLAISIVSDLFNVYNGLLLLAPYSVGCCLLFVFFSAGYRTSVLGAACRLVAVGRFIPLNRKPNRIHRLTNGLISAFLNKISVVIFQKPNLKKQKTEPKKSVNRLLSPNRVLTEYGPYICQDQFHIHTDIISEYIITQYNLLIRHINILL